MRSPAVPESGAAVHPPFAERGGGGLCTASFPASSSPSPSPRPPTAAPRLHTKTDGFIQTEISKQAVKQQAKVSSWEAKKA